MKSSGTAVRWSRAQRAKSLLRRIDAHGYALALLSVGIAFGTSLLLQHFEFRVPAAPLLLLAVAVTSWYGGPGSSVLAVILSIITFDWYFTQPARSVYMSPREIPYFITFIAFASLMSWFSTTRRRTEERLRGSEAYLAEGQRLAHTGSLAWNATGDRLVYCSEEAFRIFGFDPEAGLPAREALLRLVLPEDRDRIVKSLQSALREKVDTVDEYRIALPDGTVKDIYTIRHPVLDSAGDVVRVTGTVIDITERKRAEEKLRNSEERFRTLVQFSFDVYWETDAQHRFTRQEFTETLADAPAPGSEIGKTRWEVPYVEPNEEAWRKHRETVDARLPFRDFELARPTPDGGKRYVSVSGLPVFDPAGRFLGYRGVGRHITERKRVEAELRARQELLDLAQQAARAVAFDWYIGARESENRWSPELEAIYGLEPGTFDRSYRGWKNLIHPDDWPSVKAAINRANESGDVAAEYRVLHRDGTVHWLQAKGRMFFDAKGQPERMVGFMIDVTDWRQAEEAVRASEARFRTFVDHATDAFFLHDDDLRVIDVNRHACEALGYTRDELIGMHPSRFDAGLDERTLAQVAERVGAGETVTFETRHRHKDGREFPVEIRARQFRQGGRAFRLSLARDISDRKRAEEERREHLWFLESMDRVNRAMQGTNDLERLMSEVLDAVLDIFACDRAWLIHPCDPGAPSWSPVMERTRPEFPGAFTAGTEFPVDADVAALFAAARESDRVVHFAGEAGADVPAVAERFAIRSQMAIAVHPKIDQPYLFGVQQCSHARVWTAQEDRLFQEIGRRLADALTSLLMFRGLRDSERKLDAAQRIARVGWWERDFTTNRVALSTEVCRIFGIDPVDLPHWHQRWLSVIHPEDRARAAEAAAAALRGDARYDVEYRVVRPDGTERVVHSVGDVTRDGSGVPVRQFGMLQDITELRQAEIELRASEARFRTFVDHATDAFFRLDDHSTVIDVNRQACESLGYSRDELIGMHPRDFDAGLGASALAQIIGRIGSGDTVTFETLHRCKDGSVFPVEIRARQFEEGGRHFRLSLARDISERKRAEEALRESETRFRTFVDHAADAFFMLDSEQGTILDVNRGACESLGYSRDELIGMTPLAFDVDLDHTTFESIATRAAAGETVLFDRHRHRRKDGVLFPVEVQTSVFRHGGRRFLLKIARDITDRVEADEQRARLRALEADLAHINRVSLMGELTTSIAHEVNQPLSGVVSNASACLRWLAASPPNLEEARDAARRIVRDGKRAADVIARVRALTRRAAMPTGELDLNQTIQEVLALVGDEAKRRSVIVRTQFAGELAPVEGDRVQVQQIVLNLVMNAIDAMSGVDERTRELIITTRGLDADHVQVTVEDSGTGLDPNGMEKIFEPFYTTKAGGMGMGLSICRSMVHSQGGRLWAAAKDGPGAMFHFTLPKYAGEEPHAAAERV
jgi:PAS domain S-box-containing protein